MAEAVEIEKKRAIGYKILLDTLRQTKENEKRKLMVILYQNLSTEQSNVWINRRK